MIRTLLTILWGAALLGTLVAALLPPRPAELAPSQTLRRRAVWLSWASGIAALPLALASVSSLPIGGPPNPLGLIAFVLLCVLAVLAWGGLRWAWTRAREADRAEEHATVERFGQPRWSQPPPQPHQGLSGNEAPPTRW